MAQSLPKSFIKGFVPTLNNRGFMADTLDEISQDFVLYAAESESPVLDIGCAYGVATLPALSAGARVTACDMEQGHIDILLEKTPPAHRTRLECRVARLPEVDFPKQTFGAILCSRLLHFLTGAEIEISISKMHDWLKPGGKVFLVTDTPYTGLWKSHAPVYEEKKRQGDAWPGFIDQFRDFLPPGVDAAGQPEFLNPLDPDILRRVCVEAGFTVEKAEFLNGLVSRPGEAKPAKAHAGVIASKA